MVRYFFSIGLLSLLLLTGCNRSPLLDPIAPEAVSSSKSYFELLRHKQYEQIENALDPSIKSPDIRNVMTSMAALVPDEEPVSVKTVGARVSCKENACNNDIVLEYQFPKTWLLVNIVTRKENSNSSITGFHIQTVPESVEETNSFTLIGKKFSQYIILLLAILFPLFSVCVLILCVQTKIEAKKKWPWFVFILIGIGSLDVSWTKGQYAFHLLSFNLLSAGLRAIPYGPWILSISLPLGAILFPIYRIRHLRAKYHAALIDSVQRRGNQGQVLDVEQSQAPVEATDQHQEHFTDEDQRENQLQGADPNPGHTESADLNPEHPTDMDLGQNQLKDAVPNPDPTEDTVQNQEHPAETDLEQSQLKDPAPNPDLSEGTDLNQEHPKETDLEQSQLKDAVPDPDPIEGTVHNQEQSTETDQEQKQLKDPAPNPDPTEGTDLNQEHPKEKDQEQEQNQLKDGDQK